ncbi:AAA family ATPase, partial [Turicimonas muris]
MNTELLKRLPLGTSSFEALRESDEIYVDKTSYIYRLASNRGKYFLARPRRFGKSLLISAFESLFKHGLRDFKGLEIEKLWKDEKNYRVVRLDFARVKPEGTFKEFQEYFDDYLDTQFQKIGFKKSGSNFFTNQLEAFLDGLPASSLVLLIDEYDTPLTECLDDPKLFLQVRNYLSKFYSILKS